MARVYKPPFWCCPFASPSFTTSLGVDQAKLQDHRTDLLLVLFTYYLRLNEHDVLCYGLGVSPFSKRHILKLCLLRLKASQRCSSRLHFVMAGWFPGGDIDLRRYQQAARHYAPDVSVHFLDGKN